MSIWNYVVTAHKPTNVTHSCVGNFTSPHELNLIIAKCTRIEIHLLTPQCLQRLRHMPYRIHGSDKKLVHRDPPNERQRKSTKPLLDDVLRGSKASAEQGIGWERLRQQWK
ncbi:DNA damage-binding protein 1a [Ancistrocladus abbreviatus]